MGVYIPGMEMPNDCLECPINTEYAMCGYYEMCDKTAKTLESDYDRRPDACPLVEVRTPHGRLIDADVLLRAIDSYTVDCNPSHFDMDSKEGYGKWMHNSGFDGGTVRAHVAVDGQTTVIGAYDDGMESFIRHFKD